MIGTEKKFELPHGTTELVIDKQTFLELVQHHFDVPPVDIQIEEDTDGKLAVRLTFKAGSEPKLLTS